MMLEDLMQSLRDALAEPALREVTERLRQAGWTEQRCLAAIAECAARWSLSPLDAVVADGTLPETVASDTPLIRRYCLLLAMQAATPQLPHAPLSDEVRELVAREFQLMATPDAITTKILESNPSALVAQAQIASLTRFPTGCFHCNYGRIPRSYLPRAPWREWPRLAGVILTQLRGLGPCLELHTNPKVKILRPEDGFKAYLRMASILPHNPQLKALVGFSWLRSPATQRVSPHLRWINEIIVDNGGFETEIGPAAEDSGVFTGSKERRKMYEEGTFHPTVGLVIWPRDAMIAWAARVASEQALT